MTNHSGRASILLLTFVTTVGAAGACFSQTGMQVAPRGDSTRQAMAARMLERTRPGAQHEELATLAGDWTVQTVFRSSVRGSAPSTTDGGIAHNKLELGGRFLISATKERWGQAEVEGLSRFGFDRRTNRYTLSRCDTWGTYCVEAASAANAARTADGVTMSGATQDPLANDNERYQFVLQFDSKDQYRLSIDFLQEDGSRFRMVESTYRRANE